MADSHSGHMPEQLFCPSCSCHTLSATQRLHESTGLAYGKFSAKIFHTGTPTVTWHCLKIPKKEMLVMFKSQYFLEYLLVSISELENIYLNKFPVSCYRHVKYICVLSGTCLLITLYTIRALLTVPLSPVSQTVDSKLVLI